MAANPRTKHTKQTKKPNHESHEPHERTPNRSASSAEIRGKKSDLYHESHETGCSSGTIVSMKHSEEFLAVVEDAKSRVKEVSVEAARARLKDGATLIDVREDNEWDAGHAAGAMHMGRGIIERDIVQTFPDKTTELILYCGGGYRSALATDMLQKMGYTNVWSMAGGWKAWNDSGAPVE